ncbi:acyl-CoA dehydrogenase family protein, partial [Paraburkholderia caledonica]|uniref:acyl-CoA dehydrogenase family protein n=1 Tax=Paraburkholderia caledonica TaxID=134536 RepID=UPI00351E7FB0
MDKALNDMEFAGARISSSDSTVLAENQEPSQGPITLDALIDEIERRRDEFDGLSHVPRDMVAKMKRAGIYRASTPRRFGGDALPPPRFLEILERLAIADGSTAWVAAFGSANTYLAALPIETQAKIYARGPDQVFAGGLYPPQKAERTEGGFNVSGQWR